MDGTRNLFIKLTSELDKEIYINYRHIIKIEVVCSLSSEKKAKATIELSNGVKEYVQEYPEDILSYIPMEP